MEFAGESARSTQVTNMKSKPLLSEMNLDSLALVVGEHPGFEPAQDDSRIFEPKGFLAGVSADFEGFVVPGRRDRLKLAVERVGQTGAHDDGSYGDHREVSRDGTIRLDIDHDVAHVGASFMLRTCKM
jgi:hypothetical protein